MASSPPALAKATLSSRPKPARPVASVRTPKDSHRASAQKAARSSPAPVTAAVEK